MRATPGSRTLAALVLLLGAAGSAPAHELRPAYLELTELESGRVRVLWRKPNVGEAIPYLAPKFPPSWKAVEKPRTAQAPDSEIVRAAAFGFGLVHGLGFASGLSTLGLPPREVVAALFLFNVGVEAGQLVFVGLYFAVARSLRRLEVPQPRWAEAIPGCVVGCLGGYWTIAQLAALLGARA